VVTWCPKPITLPARHGKPTLRDQPNNNNGKLTKLYKIAQVSTNFRNSTFSVLSNIEQIFKM